MEVKVMTTDTIVEEGQLDHRQLNHEIAQLLGWAVTIALVLMGIWFSSHLLSWAVDHRDLRSISTPTSDVTMAVRDKQLACLTKNIYYEAGGEPFEGKVAVAQVTLNRARSSDFPDDICKVIYQKNVVYQKVMCQFSWVCESASGIKPTNSREFNESQAVAKRVLLEGFRLPSLENAMYFHGDYINPGWKREKVAHIGHHIFYK
jgi:spore germination cell wall hydrolase CwlJ-like protein